MDNPEFYRVSQEDLDAGLQDASCALCRNTFALEQEYAVVPTEAVKIVPIAVPLHSMCIEAVMAGILPAEADVEILGGRRGIDLCGIAESIREMPEHVQGLMVEALHALIESILTGEDPPEKWKNLCSEHGFDCPTPSDDLHGQIAAFLDGV